jgi:hypothetical protein
MLGPLPTWTLIGTQKITASATSLGTISNIPAYDMLAVMVMITGYSGSDIASLRFNGDTAANYSSRYISYATNSTTGTNNFTSGATLIRLGIATNKGRSAFALINNPATVSKVVSVHTQIGSGAATTEYLVTTEGGGEWNNTSSQINSIQVLTAGGSVTMNAGSGFAVFGFNF